MRHILLTGIIILFTIQAQATVIYVTPDGKGDGSSWMNASGKLAESLLSAKPGDEVWVAKGTYYPTDDKNRSKSFIVPAGVKLYGSFNGNETSPLQRNTQQITSQLSGNIGSKADQTDNSYTVVYMKDTGKNTLMDGFIISDGTSDGNGPTSSRERCGGGIYIDGSGKGKEALPVIFRCTFKNNYAKDGAAAYINGRSGNCSPTFNNCKFQNNYAELDGGAVFNDGRHEGISNPVFNGCSFNGNKGNYGGAICNYGGKGECSPEFLTCIFRDNEAFLRGGAIFNMDIEGIVAPVVNNCQFLNNEAVAGKGMYTFSKFNEKNEGAVDTGLKMN